MSLALVLTRTMKASRSALVLLLLCGLILSGLPYLDALEGDACTVKSDLAGICRASSKCEPIVDKYFKSGRLTILDIPSCGLGTHEEIVCCPHELGTSQVASTTTSTTTSTSTTTRRTTTTTRRATTTTTRRPTTPTTSKLNQESPYFDFSQLLNGKPTKRPSQDHVPSNSNANGPEMNPSQQLPQPSPPLEPTWRSTDGFQSVGPMGPAPSVGRQSRIINRPQSLRWPERPGRRSQSMVMPGRDSGDLIQLVNDRLRQQGMDIVPGHEVITFEMESTSTARPPPVATIPNVDLDPWAPFRFRPSPADELNSNDLSNGVAEAFGSETTTTRTIQPTPTTRVDISPTTERPAVRACREFTERQEANALSPHILNGLPVEDGTYPHMAAIAYSVFGRIDYRCGGSLISTRHVLTAAHCVNSESDTPVHVRLGTVNIEEVNDSYQDIAVTSNIRIHPEYVSSSKYNDVAILELVEEVKLSFTVFPACLETNPVDPPAAAKLFVAGWGVMNTTNRHTSKKLLRAPLNIVPLDQCQLSYMGQPTSSRFLEKGIVDSLLCAADLLRQAADACQGDSGGPLVYERDIVNSKYTLLGIISSGFGCATKTPGLYARVASYLDFIESVVWPNNVV
ncbi:serine protease persephone-like isoform X2 [Drosophila innubila]|uniref:serine protease persephone-like isoform X2 n=1 Tax=Drosophila innubila TaxID=198719 RepID=UPI00148E7A1B|nr:serine protease persephone-like isoform X2 [Drosophila innubila]